MRSCVVDNFLKGRGGVAVVGRRWREDGAMRETNSAQKTIVCDCLSVGDVQGATVSLRIAARLGARCGEKRKEKGENKM